jgi:hypothetical protein
VRSPGEASNECVLEALTKEALAAAEAGQWNRVEACYAKRAQRLPACALSQETAARLSQMDGAIVARALVVRAAVGLKIGEVEKDRRRLADLKLRIGGQTAMNAGDWISRMA